MIMLPNGAEICNRWYGTLVALGWNLVFTGKEGVTMLHNLKPALGKAFCNPQTLRAGLILLTLLIAALVGGAPNDHGGGGG
jgi:hypothetical protein